MIKNSIALLAFFCAQWCFAARTINIMSSSTGVKITNPSAVSVNYDVTCYTSGGGVYIAKTGEVLDVNATNTYGQPADLTTVTNIDSCKGSPAIVPSTSPLWIGLGGGLNGKLCSTPVSSYDNAASACGAGLEPCEYHEGNYVMCSSNNFFWLLNPSSLEVSTDNGSTWSSADLSVNAISLGGMTGNKCRINSASTPSYYCQAVPKTTATNGVICCPAKAPAFCKITINTTDSKAHLASSSFKGGAPF